MAYKQRGWSPFTQCFPGGNCKPGGRRTNKWRHKWNKFKANVEDVFTKDRDNYITSSVKTNDNTNIPGVDDIPTNIPPGMRYDRNCQCLVPHKGKLETDGKPLISDTPNINRRTLEEGYIESNKPWAEEGKIYAPGRAKIQKFKNKLKSKNNG